ncbi:MAG: hypothetical protein ABIY70_23620 [Capsulimonas sp.]|uniref:hypothetical protein n=1 Tax=Capsulimonas sp. TaxID=2494211 RepID=UPI003262E243
MADGFIQDRIVADYKIGDKIRVVQVPPYLYNDDPVTREIADFFELCLGKVFRIEAFDENGQLELWMTDKGNRTKRGDLHSIWIEPEYVEPYPKSHGLKGDGI